MHLHEESWEECSYYTSEKELLVAGWTAEKRWVYLEGPFLKVYAEGVSSFCGPQ